MSYMMAVQIASRNARTLRWLSVQTPELIKLMREYYASYLDVPLREVCSSFTSNAELRWVYCQFAADITEWAKHN